MHSCEKHLHFSRHIHTFSRVLAALFLLATVVSSAFGCAKNEDFFDPFKEGFEAELSGTWEGLDFSGVIEAEPSEHDENGAPRPFAGSFTFYAPAELAGTVVSRDAEGNYALRGGSVTVPLPEGTSYEALFALFPTSGSITDVRVDEKGHTVLQTDHLTLHLLPDGTPLAAETAKLRADVVSFRSASTPDAQ